MDRDRTEKMATQNVPIVMSHLELPEKGSLRRLPRQPKRPRDQSFIDNFDARTLYFDCFWHHDRSDILLIGGAATNLKKYFKQATFRALPSKQLLKARHYFSLSVMRTDLVEAPADTTAIEIEFAGQRFEVEVRTNLSQQFADQNILFTLSKNNDLDWIRFWADYHVRKHGVSAIVLFDNGSTDYDNSAIEETLATVHGLKQFTVASVPYPYGYKDEILKVNPYWPQFLQVALMSIVVRRFGAYASSIVNLDVDELAVADGKVCELVKSTDMGILALKGVWIEPIADENADGRDHRSFNTKLRDEDLSRCDAGKWVVDPSRKWIEKPFVFPYMHWIERRPLIGKRYVDGAHFLHFKAINTGWKTNRQQPQEFNDKQHLRLEIEW